MTLQQVVLYTSIVGSVATAAVAGISFYAAIYPPVRPAKGARLSYRIYNDTQLAEPDRSRREPTGQGKAEWVLQYRDRFSGAYRDAPDPSTALIGIRNSGSVTIRQEDFAYPISITFENRKILNAEIVERGDALMAKSIFYKQESDAPGAGVLVDRSGNRLASEPPGALKVEDGSVTLPQILINPRDEFKLFFWLSGALSDVRFEANINNGYMRRDSGDDSGPGRLLRRPLIWVATLILFVGGIVASRVVLSVTPIPKACVQGHISVGGSSAFTPAASEIAARYMSMCPKSTITVIGTDSFQAVDDVEAGRISIAMSDGPAANAGGGLFLHPEAIVIFSVVVNSSANIHSLTLQQIQEIYTGRIQNWHSLGGPNQRIVVVTRERTSGSRATFGRTVLGPALKRGIRAVLRTSTMEMLAYVNDHPGAIGYAETTTASSTRNFPNLIQVQLNSINPSPQTVKNRQYPFWAVESFYTHARNPTGLLAAFLKYLTADTSRATMLDFGHIPCQDGQGGTLVLCTKASG